MKEAAAHRLLTLSGVGECSSKDSKESFKDLEERLSDKVDKFFSSFMQQFASQAVSNFPFQLPWGSQSVL